MHAVGEAQDRVAVAVRAPAQRDVDGDAAQAAARLDRGGVVQRLLLLAELRDVLGDPAGVAESALAVDSKKWVAGRRGDSVSLPAYLQIRSMHFSNPESFYSPPVAGLVSKLDND